MSICTGAFVLAEAGLLDGRRATTHWASTAELARRYPEVTVEPDVLYVDEGSVLTSAGVAAGLDLCLHVIRRDHGAALAARLARRTVVAPHRDGGQAQFVDRPIDTATGGIRLARAHPAVGAVATRSAARRRLDGAPGLHVSAHLRPPLPPGDGYQPGPVGLEQRTRAAQALLESTDLPVEHVAERCWLRQRGHAAHPFRPPSVHHPDRLPAHLQARLNPYPRCLF